MRSLPRSHPTVRPLHRNTAVALAALAVAAVTACASADASPEDCEGSPVGGAAGITISPGPPIHDGYYSQPECRKICLGYSTCAPTLEQRSQPRYRCGAPPSDPACGPRHQPRPNVKGPCDSEGFDVEISRTQWEADRRECDRVCVPALFGGPCQEVPSASSTTTLVVRCGEPRPAGC